MRFMLPIIAATIVLPATMAMAKDRPITDQERPKLEAALREVACSGGKMEFDDDKAAAYPMGKFEVDDSTCQEGKKYDLTFDAGFKLLTKKPD